jgi:hypothetical protein
MAPLWHRSCVTHWPETNFTAMKYRIERLGIE